MNVFHVCQLLPVEVPPELNRVKKAYRVSDDGAAPEIRQGDILCCENSLKADAARPRVAVAELASGRAVLVREGMQLAAIRQVYAIKFIIKG